MNKFFRFRIKTPNSLLLLLLSFDFILNNDFLQILPSTFDTSQLTSHSNDFSYFVISSSSISSQHQSITSILKSPSQNCDVDQSLVILFIGYLKAVSHMS